MNTLRTTILLAVLTALLVWIGDMFGGRRERSWRCLLPAS